MALTDETVRQSLNAEFPGNQAVRLGNLFETLIDDAGTAQAAVDALEVNAIGTSSVGVSNTGTVAQLTSKSTGVTLNAPSGQITMHTEALAAAAEASFTFTNSSIGATDVVVLAIKSGGAAASYLCGVGATAAGSCSIVLANVSAGSLSEAVVLNFVVISGG